MRDVLPEIDRWRSEGRPIAIAVVVQIWGSAPRGVGAKMALTPDGRIAGSVSGGCVEAGVAEAGLEVLKTGVPRLLRFGVADETAWGVGLSCGGTIEVFVKPLRDGMLMEAVRRAIAENRPAAIVTVIRGPAKLLGRELLVLAQEPRRGEIGAGLDRLAENAARAALEAAAPRRVELNGEGAEMEPVEIFVDVLLPPPAVIAIGGVHVSQALVAQAKTLGYRTIVVDPRRAFGNSERFPNVDRLIRAWPDEGLAEVGLDASSAVAVLTHDPKLDDPALRTALLSPAFYVGALGSRSTQAARRERLLAAGLTEAQLARLHAPIGLDLGAHTPEEIALSVMAEIVAARNGVVPAGK